MKLRKILQITAILSTIILLTYIKNADANESINYEKSYELFYKQIISQGKIDLMRVPYMDKTQITNSPAIEALWNSLWESKNPFNKMMAISSLKKINLKQFTMNDQLYITILNKEFLGRSDRSFTQQIKRDSLNISSVYIILSYKGYFEKETLEFIQRKHSELYEQFNLITTGFENKSKEEIQDLFYNHPDFKSYKNGKYAEGIKVFMFCRRDRNQKCLLLMKDKYNNIVKNDSGEYWSQPALGLSRHGLPFNQRNGNTPSGIFEINSVMPEANKKIVYGKNRRLILNFPSKSKDESEFKKLLPQSAHDKLWWQQGIIARDVGRGLFRIHGTGLKNKKKSSAYYPLYPTSGCIAQRENKYAGIKYKDQRHLLDQMMQSLELPVKFSSERKIKGLIFVIELNDQKKSVTYNDMKEYLNI